MNFENAMKFNDLVSKIFCKFKLNVRDLDLIGEVKEGKLTTEALSLKMIKKVYDSGFDFLDENKDTPCLNKILEAEVVSVNIGSDGVLRILL